MDEWLPGDEAANGTEVDSAATAVGEPIDKAAVETGTLALP